MKDFPKRLKELMEFYNLTKKDVSRYLELNNDTKIYIWLKGKNTPRFETIVKIANLFKCSLDYLLGRTDDFTEKEVKELPKFSEHFKKVLKQQKSSQYKILKDNVLSHGHLSSWLNKQMYPSTENIIKLANYLNISIDYLVGRE